MPAHNAAITAAEVRSLFQDLENVPVLVLAVSGGPDSTALMVLAARWRAARHDGPKLLAVTVDHGLRKESKREAADVAKLAKTLGIDHRTLRWTARKPATGLPQAAREARYRLLAELARKVGSTHILIAHTLDDQAETVMIRMIRGSGITGLAAMAPTAPVPGGGEGTMRLVRPFLAIPKARLIATLEAEGIAFADDPTNRDAAFTRARLRGLMPQLAAEGLDAGRLSLLARRLKRADAAIEAAVDEAMALLHLSQGERSRAKRAGEGLCPIEKPLPPHPSPLPQGERECASMRFDARAYFRLPAEIGLRLLGRAIDAAGDEGPVELAKLEALKIALDRAHMTGTRLRRTLAGALVTLAKGQITVERAPQRRDTAAKRNSGRKALTKRQSGRAGITKNR